MGYATCKQTVITNASIDQHDNIRWWYCRTAYKMYRGTGMVGNSAEECVMLDDSATPSCATVSASIESALDFVRHWNWHSWKRIKRIKQKCAAAAPAAVKSLRAIIEDTVDVSTDNLRRNTEQYQTLILNEFAKQSAQHLRAGVANFSNVAHENGHERHQYGSSSETQSFSEKLIQSPASTFSTDTFDNCLSGPMVMIHELVIVILPFNRVNSGLTKRTPRNLKWGEGLAKLSVRMPCD